MFPSSTDAAAIRVRAAQHLDLDECGNRLLLIAERVCVDFVPFSR